MSLTDKRPADATNKTRREAAAWFARLRGPQSAEQTPAFDQWRKDRPDRQAAYDRLLRRWDDAAVLQSSKMDFGLAGRHAYRRRPMSQLRRLWPVVPAAAALSFLVYLWPARPAWFDAWPVPSAWSQRLATPVGTIRTVKLPDGSTVTLDTGSVARWRFSTSARNVILLSGRARFTVAHDSARPFFVEAGGGQVAAHGTVFDVSLTTRRQVDVTLLQGVVEVDSAAGADRHRTTMRAGQELAYGRDLAAPRLRPLPPSDATWPSGMLTFAGTPLSQALAEANRYLLTPIRLASSDLGQLQVSGVFRVGAARPLAESLATTFDLRLQSAADGGLVLERPTPASEP